MQAGCWVPKVPYDIYRTKPLLDKDPPGTTSDLLQGSGTASLSPAASNSIWHLVSAG